MDKKTEDIIKKEVREWCDGVFKERVSALIEWKIGQLEREFDQRVLIAIAKKFFEPVQVSVKRNRPSDCWHCRQRRS